MKLHILEPFNQENLTLDKLCLLSYRSNLSSKYLPQISTQGCWNLPTSGGTRSKVRAKRRNFQQKPIFWRNFGEILEKLWEWAVAPPPCPLVPTALSKAILYTTKCYLCAIFLNFTSHLNAICFKQIVLKIFHECYCEFAK